MSGAKVRLAGVGHVHSAASPWARRALTGVDLDLAPGERVAVVGTNGSGKSTLAWILAGLTEPTEGTAELVDDEGARPLVEAVGRLGLSVQHARLQLLQPTPAEEFAAVVPEVDPTEALGVTGLGPELLDRQIDLLSGGQLRRVALAIVLAREPDVVVLDEPLAGLDVPGRDAVLAAVDECAATVVVVTHDLGPFLPHVPRVLELHDGRLVAP